MVIDGSCFRDGACIGAETTEPGFANHGRAFIILGASNNASLLRQWRTSLIEIISSELPLLQQLLRKVHAFKNPL